jgi:acyl-homoserine lactone acylase PvdQ
MDSESVAATIFNTLIINFLEETINDEMDNSAQFLMENYYYIIDKFYDMLLAGNSPLFDDINTKGSVELRDNIFDRAFIKTLRYLNKQCGPIMENWKWGSLHKGHFIVPLGKESFFGRIPSKLEPVEIPGDNSSLNKGDVSAVNLLKPGNISVMSGLFFLDLHLSFFSLSISPSLDTRSEYFRNYSKLSGFINIETAEAMYKLQLLPNKK